MSLRKTAEAEAEASLGERQNFNRKGSAEHTIVSDIPSGISKSSSKKQK
jgi:hypothetical protein